MCWKLGEAFLMWWKWQAANEKWFRWQRRWWTRSIARRGSQKTDSRWKQLSLLHLCLAVLSVANIFVYCRCEWEPSSTGLSVDHWRRRESSENLVQARTFGENFSPNCHVVVPAFTPNLSWHQILSGQMLLAGEVGRVVKKHSVIILCHHVWNTTILGFTINHCSTKNGRFTATVQLIFCSLTDSK